MLFLLKKFAEILFHIDVIRIIRTPLSDMTVFRNVGNSEIISILKWRYEEF